jgi:hypothetical protein
MSALDQLGAALGPGGPGGGPPSHIPIPSGPSDAAGPAPDAGGDSGPGDGPDSPKVSDAVNTAIDAISGVIDLEGDAADKAFLAKVVADLHKFLGDQQKLADQAMGAGPGAKMIRKASSPGY